ncbi:DeoR/GlpR family DNA-binding transcription regulator [Jannaschia pohangensis]|uniref:Transcriptional regulator, DeoR family n=1 Tax=Jannaschia pohangensis TaxID=390807 RepID=A0A1I3P165_9RHOB|nr:DeoR/GlpR family DNA-binding transcription regulator [Jannaschia pohangensis]SFJ15189.1 transcriptional regulator, DeoR family [Jannaschia pohangensis]
MGQTLRKPEIINMARREGKVTVDGLVDHFGVTPQTIRRDLTELAEDGKLERVHGGAILPSGTVNIGYNERRQINLTAKVDIARQCARYIPHGSSLLLNIGTTTEAVATELLNHQGLLVVTNNINIAVTLSGNPDANVIVTGGSLRRSDGGLVGSLATQTIEQFKFDYAIIGCSALSDDGDILDFDIQEVGVTKSIIQQSREVFLVADGSKFDRSAPVRVGSLADVDMFFTDLPLSPASAALCDQSGTRVRYAGQDYSKLDDLDP